MKRLVTTTCWIIAAMAAGSFAESSMALRQGTFEVRQTLQLQIPDGAHRVRLWLVLPQEEPAQKVENLRVTARYPHRVERDSENNQLLYMDVQNPREKRLQVEMSFVLTRSEILIPVTHSKSRPLSAEERARFRGYLEPNQYIPVNQAIRELAEQILANETNPVRVARKLYDWIIDNTDYYAKDPKRLRGSDEGSAVFCLSKRTGNCGDMGSLWISLARSRGIPARMVYGSFFKPDLNGKDQDVNAHSWVEFYAPELGWIPLDVSLGDIYTDDFQITPENRPLLRLATPDGTFGSDPRKREYYFGSLDQRRMTWSRGRDLTLNPRQSGGPVNALFEAYVEVDGKPLPGEGGAWLRKVTYRQRD